MIVEILLKAREISFAKVIFMLLYLGTKPNWTSCDRYKKKIDARDRAKQVNKVTECYFFIQNAISLKDIDDHGSPQLPFFFNM